MFINESIELDVEELPKVLQNLIKDCERYDNEDDEIMYIGMAEGLAVISKNLYAENVITMEQRRLIGKKYCRME